jgi:hypothetical protein
MPSEIVELCGLLLYFIDAFNTDSFRVQMESRYGFPLCEISGGEVKPDGTYIYPEDPILYPIMEIRRGEEICWIYEYAIVAFNNGFVTRMD